MLKDNQKIVAIAWEAKKQDLSYGMFSAMLTEESKIHIYKEYEEYLMAKEAAEKARIRKYSKGRTKSNVPK
ncbi:MAG: hypothetical protein K1W19_15740 [Lachnospiraceae bacterium]